MMIMKKRKRIWLFITGCIVVLIASGLTYIQVMLPNTGSPPNLHATINSETVARGSYLANHVLLCTSCHSMRDWRLFSGPIQPGTTGAGNAMFDQSLGLPGRFVAGNLTPTGMANWTDGELFRAITSGVSKNGRALFPVMPYRQYGKMDTADILAVIAYIRTLPPVEHPLPTSHANFPVNIIINTMPQKAHMQRAPSKNDPVNYGRYLATASCSGCHTPRNKPPFSGGFEFRLTEGSLVRSANITPHQTGIGQVSKEQFIALFKRYTDTSCKRIPVQPGEFQTVMPWQMLAGMKREDLAAIYDYLRTVTPVENGVTRFTSRILK
jgi:mono/diheme cytochrome c family protein